MTLLDVRGLDAGYGDFQALFGLDLSIEEGETLAIIGANGAGKTTFLQVLAGLVGVKAGSVTFAGEDLAALKAHRRVAAGIALVPEGRRLFPSLSVRENLLIGAHTKRPGPWTIDRILEVLPLIERLMDRPADVLSGGEKQAVAIGRALMANPKLVLLDEVSLGLAPIVINDLYAALPAIVEGGTTALIVEQDIGQALKVADQVICLLEGRVSLSGTPETLSREQIAAAYFGMVSAEGGDA